MISKNLFAILGQIQKKYEVERKGRHETLNTMVFVVKPPLARSQRVESFCFLRHRIVRHVRTTPEHWNYSKPQVVEAT